ncbi:MAG: lipopolysaccharide biosynthesis protein [Promethearchaeota archaeon]
MKPKKLSSYIMIICLIALFTCSMSMYFLILPTRGETTAKKQVLVLSEGEDTLFVQSLRVDENNFDVIVGDISLIDSSNIVILFDMDLPAPSKARLVNYVENGGALLIFMGNDLHADPSLLLDLNLLTTTNFEINEETHLFIVRDENHPIGKNIDWNSAPNMKVESMTRIPLQSFNPSAQPIVDTYPVSQNLAIDEYRQPILVEMSRGKGDILFFAGWLEEGYNKDFKLWPYFNYLLYSMMLESLNQPFDTYPVWPYSPVPHLTDQIILGIMIIALALLAITLYKVVKKRSTTKMDQATIKALERIAVEEEKRKLEEARALEEKLEKHIDLKDDWEVIGIHRQLGGFLFTLFIGLIIVIPQLLVSNFVMPQIIQPYPQAAGWYYLTYNIFQIAWLLFDFGTSYALAKYFSQYRVKNPEKAIHYIQIFVWWQLFTGLVQVSVFAFIGSLIYPHTNLAHMSWIFITFSLVQYPGFFLVFMYTFQGMQRSDYHLILYVAWEVVFLIIGQVVFCYIGRLWGAANPAIGEALGAGIGYSIARYFDYWATFTLSVVIFKKMGFSPKTCFRIDFIKEEFQEVMRYGSRLAFGESFVQIGYFLQILIASAFIANYSNEFGYFQLTWNIGMIIQIVTLYGQSLLGAFSESTAHGKKTLTKLYIFQAFRWGNYFAYFLISVLFAVGAKFIVGAAGEEYGGPAVRFLIPLLIFHTFGVYSWLVDAVFEGTGRTDFAAYVWILEQTTRAILMYILVVIFKDMIMVLIAYIPAVFTKDVVSWLIVKYKITEYKLYIYKTFITPILAAICNYIVLYFIGELLWGVNMGDKIINTSIIFITGIFLFLYFYAFVDGLFGGYDHNTIQELEKATKMVKGKLGILSKLIYKAANAGAKISPLHDKFKIDIYETAMQEAYELTLEKKVLKI